jgi:hypothetical protein
VAFDAWDITNESYSLVIFDVTDCGMQRKLEGTVPGIYWSKMAAALVEYVQTAIKTRASKGSEIVEKS